MLKRNSKMKFDQFGIDRSLYTEMHTDPAVDDVVAFMAFSEAERRYKMPRNGLQRTTQTPSDELKSFLLRVVDEP